MDRMERTRYRLASQYWRMRSCDHEGCRIRLARQEFVYHRLDVEDRRSIDGVEFGDDKLRAFAAQDAADGAADAIGTLLGALGENADGRPCRVVARMPR